MDRAQSEVIGVVLLFGMVILGAGGVFVVGSEALAAIESQSDSEQDLMELQSLAHEVETVSRVSERGQIGVADQYERVDGGTLTIEVDGEEEFSESLGRLVKDDLVYEGGLVIQDDRVVSSPSFETRDGTSEIALPFIIGDEFSGELEAVETEALSVDDPTADVRIIIQSEYAEAWKDSFADLDAEVEKVGDDTVEVYFEGGDAPTPPTFSSAIEVAGGDGETTFGEVGTFLVDSYQSSEGEYDDSDREGEGTISSPSGIHFAAGGGGNTDLKVSEVISGDRIQVGPHQDQLPDEVVHEDVENVPIPESTQEIIDDVDSTQGSEVDSSTIDAIEAGGEFHTTDDLTIGDEDLTFEEDSTIFVNGDLDIEDSTIVVEDSLRLYVDGDFYIGDNTVIETADNPHKATKVSIFSAGDVVAGEEISGGSPGGGGGPGGDQGQGSDDTQMSVTGLIHASDSTLYANENLEIFGAMSIGDFKSESTPQNGGLILHYDEDLLETELYEEEIDLSIGSEHTRDSYHLRFVLHEIESS